METGNRNPVLTKFLYRFWLICSRKWSLNKMTDFFSKWIGLVVPFFCQFPKRKNENQTDWRRRKKRQGKKVINDWLLNSTSTVKQIENNYWDCIRTDSNTRPRGLWYVRWDIFKTNINLQSKKKRFYLSKKWDRRKIVEIQSEELTFSTLSHRRKIIDKFWEENFNLKKSINWFAKLFWALGIFSNERKRRK